MEFFRAKEAGIGAVSLQTAKTVRVECLVRIEAGSSEFSL